MVNARLKTDAGGSAFADVQASQFVRQLHRTKRILADLDSVWRDLLF